MADIDEALNKAKTFYERMDLLAEHLTELMMEDIRIHNEATEYGFSVNRIPEGEGNTDDQQDLICLSQMDYYKMVMSKALYNLCQMADPANRNH